MTKIAILSDTHLDRLPMPAIDPEALPEFDVIIHAGDLSERHPDKALAWLRKLAGERPVIFCPGNHDHYAVGDRWKDTPLRHRMAQLACAASEHNVRVLLPNCVFGLPDVGIVGSTLWSDWRLAGLWHCDPDSDEAERDLAALELLRTVRSLSSSEFFSLKDRFGREWSPWTCMAEHAVHVEALDRVLSGLIARAKIIGDTSPRVPLVVVTHHAPHPRSVEPYREMPLPDWAPGFYGSDLTWLIERHRPAAWVHGHVHVPVDYLVGDTRIVSNPCPNSFELKIVEV